MDHKQLQVCLKSQAMDQVSSGTHHSLIIHDLLQRFPARASEQRCTVVYSRVPLLPSTHMSLIVMGQFAHCISVLALIWHAFPTILIGRCAAQLGLFKNQTSSCWQQVCYLYHHSCFRDVPGHVQNTDDYTEPSLFFVISFHDVCCDIVLGPSVTQALLKSTHHSLITRNICSWVLKQRR